MRLLRPPFTPAVLVRWLVWAETRGSESGWPSCSPWPEPHFDASRRTAERVRLAAPLHGVLPCGPAPPARAAVRCPARGGCAASSPAIRCESGTWLPYDSGLLLSLVSLELALPSETPDARADLRRALACVATAVLGLAAYSLCFYRWRALGFLLALRVLAATGAGLWLAARAAHSVDRRRCIASGLAGGLALSVDPAYYSFHAGVLALIAFGGRRDAVFSVSRARASRSCAVDPLNWPSSGSACRVSSRNRSGVIS